MSRRTDRVNVTLKKELGALIAEELNDPRLARFTSITRVDVSPDLARARVYVSVLEGADEREGSLKALRSAAGRLRNGLRSRVKIRRIPELHFEPDVNIEEGEEMSRLIDRVADADRRRSEARPGL